MLRMMLPSSTRTILVATPSQLNVGVAAGSETSPALRRGTNNNCLPAARCIRATRFGKIDDLPFALLRAHILIQKITLSHAWLCSMAQVEPLEATG
jgi:hypothetical protein